MGSCPQPCCPICSRWCVYTSSGQGPPCVLSSKNGSIRAWMALCQAGWQHVALLPFRSAP